MKAAQKLQTKQDVARPLCVSIDLLLKGSSEDGQSVLEKGYDFNSAVVSFLQQEHFNGRKLFLTSEHDSKLAYQVAEALQVFYGVISDHAANENGARKPMQELLLAAFGRKNFDFLGDAKVDAEVVLNANRSFEVSKHTGSVQEMRPRLAEPSMFAGLVAERTSGSISDYVQIARPDNWFKNIFVLPGVFLVPFFFPVSLTPALLLSVILSLAATCLVASSYYVINEVLDAPQDRFHPVKRNRPVAAGRIHIPTAYAEWLVLGALGVSLGFFVSNPVGICCLALWIMGCLYNIPPVRTKELPYLDVLSESLNNPLRMAIGWYAVGVAVVPPVSALFAYWMLGAFLMATKRFAEYRRIGDSERAAQYRSSFRYYNEENLLASNVAYVALFMTGAMAFVMLYQLELVFVAPAFAYLFAYYVYLGFKEDSPVQYPERLYREHHLTIGVLLSVAWCLALFFMVDLPWFRDLFQLLTPQY
jgi:4-hydroxybenzoate polyprenyltransferase